MTTLMILRSRDNTPAPLLNMDREHEEQMMDNFRGEILAKRKAKQDKADEIAAAEVNSKDANTTHNNITSGFFFA